MSRGSDNKPRKKRVLTDEHKAKISASCKKKKPEVLDKRKSLITQLETRLTEVEKLIENIQSKLGDINDPYSL